MPRIRQNFWTGTLSAQLASNGTSMSCEELATFPAVTGTNVAVFVIGPSSGTAEVVYCTAHTASATTATITRAQDSTTALTWASGTTVICSPVVTDLPVVLTDAEYDAITPDDNIIYITTG